ncbi:MAG: DNA repair protein RecO [bacterium]|nr:DNA repair protein RecO [bacterium]
MSRSRSLDCVILKRFDLGEADRVLIVFSRELGKISVMAKGVRRIVSRKAGSVEIGNNSRIFVVEGKNFYILQEVKILHAFLTLGTQLPIFKYGYYVLELVDKLTQPEEQQESVYKLLVEILQILNINPRKIFIRAFEIKLLHRLGFLTVTGMDLQAGSISGSEFLDDDSLDLLMRLQEESWQDISEMDLSEDSAYRLEQFMKFRLQLLVERDLKSLYYFD